MVTSEEAAWLGRQAIYWDSVAPVYPTFYETEWSWREDTALRSHLDRHLDTFEPKRLLDVGCGPGNLLIGYSRMLRATYFGVDLSRLMLRAKQAHSPGSLLIRADMARLPFAGSTFDVCVGSFGIASYAYDIELLLSELARVTKPNGILFLSALSRLSLRRLLRCRLSRDGSDRTRCDTHSAIHHPARYYRPGQLRHVAQRHGFRNDAVYGDGLLAGVLEAKFLWRLNAILSQSIPSASHSFLLVATRRADCP